MHYDTGKTITDNELTPLQKNIKYVLYCKLLDAFLLYISLQSFIYYSNGKLSVALIAYVHNYYAPI